jgi:dTDP-4-dehydrorhamnose reductase
LGFGVGKKKILVTGATGMLGSTLVPFLRECGYSVITQGRLSAADFSADLTRQSDASALIVEMAPDVIINLIGLTSVEGCEENLHRAYLVNTKTVENIVDAMRSQKIDSHLIHISTDHIYDGSGIHAEGDVTITNNYAITKYAGELAALQVRSAILRTNFIGRSGLEGRQSLTDWVFQSMKRGDSIEVLTDVLFNPLSMACVSEMVDMVVQKESVGIFNLGSQGGMSKADLDFAFAEAVGLPTKSMTRINSSEARFLRAYRPKNMRMSSSKFESVLGVTLPTLEEEINRVAREYV